MLDKPYICDVVELPLPQAVDELLRGCFKGASGGRMTPRPAARAGIFTEPISDRWHSCLRCGEQQLRADCDGTWLCMQTTQLSALRSSPSGHPFMMRFSREPARLVRLLLLTVSSTTWVACTSAQELGPIPKWALDSSMYQLLPGVEQQVRLSPCLMFRATSNLSSDITPVQCTANPEYLLAQAYKWSKETVMLNATATITVWRNNTPVTPPQQFTTTILRRALFRIAQKQHWCRQYSSEEECIADTRTPCAFVQDERLTYSLGLSESNSSCVHYTQSSFFRLLIWEMFSLENQTMNSTSLPAALNCLWPPFKRQAIECSSDKVSAFCAKLPPWCHPIVDTFRFSCQCAHAQDEWRRNAQYTADDFNATQHMYRAAMHRLYSATMPHDVYQSAWGDTYTSWFLYQLASSRRGMEHWMSAPAENKSAGVSYPYSFRPEAACSRYKTEQECVNPDGADEVVAGQTQTTPHADATYCSWSREQIIPGMSNADNPDFPRRRCQLSTKARLEAAVILDGTRENLINKEPKAAGYLTPTEDLLSFLYDTMYYTDRNHTMEGMGDTWCGDPYDCRVAPLESPMVFPAWQPSMPRGSAENCEEALQEDWEA